MEMEVEASGLWTHKNPELVGTNIPPYVQPVLSAEKTALFSNTASAYDYYKLFQPNTFAEEIVYQSKLYAVQKNLKKSLDCMNIDTYRYSIKNNVKCTREKIKF
jgi:hypothetical protein